MSGDDRAFHVELDISADFKDHEAFVIIDALEEYASSQRWQADGMGEAHTAFLNELADAADRLRERIDAQMGDANIIERQP
jgi:hypothetical protein